MAAFHHGISAQEVVQGILPMRNANVSVIGLVVTSTDADADMYPLDTPVLLTGITQDNIDKSGTTGTLRNCLQTIRDIHNPTLVILRVDAVFDVDLLDILLTCPARFGLMPKRLGAPEIDTPDVVLKLVSIANRRRAMVYASPRKTDGILITDKAEIVAYRDTFGDRELCLIDGEWGVPGKSEGSGGGNGADTAGTTDITFLKLEQKILGATDGVTGKIGMAYSINGGAISPAFFESPTSSGAINLRGVTGVFRETEAVLFLIDMTSDLFNSGEVGLPLELDDTAAYLFGSSNALLSAALERIGTPLPEGFVVPEAPVTITLYPASSIPSAEINYDVFDLIIDPASYTQADLQYFADRGVTPAVKNSDGSYTIKSQLTLPGMG